MKPDLQAEAVRLAALSPWTPAEAARALALAPAGSGARLAELACAGYAPERAVEVLKGKGFL